MKIDEPIDSDLCTTMDDVRAGIDDLDRRIVRLLAERQGFIEAAARIKGERHSIRDEARISDVLARVRAEAERAGLSQAIAEPVWRALIEASIAHELAAFEKRQNQIKKTS